VRGVRPIRLWAATILLPAVKLGCLGKDERLPEKVGPAPGAAGIGLAQDPVTTSLGGRADRFGPGAVRKSIRI
jgi:hypothetical protein